jgi:hypothetical protein
MWYGGSVEGGIFLEPEEGKWDELKKLVRELHDMADVFASPSEPPPTFEPKDAPISVALKRTPRGRILLVVNRGDQSVDVTFAMPVATGECKLLNEERTAPIRRQSMRLSLQGYGTHAYQIP